MSTGNKWKLTMRERSRVRPTRRFDVDLLPVGAGPRGDEVQLTCASCGESKMESMSLMSMRPDKRTDPRKEADIKPCSRQVVERMARYWSKGNRISGECKPCTKIARDKLFPLPKKEEGR